MQVLIMACPHAQIMCGGPLDSTVTIVMLIYLEAFSHLQMGFAAALSFILFTMIGLVTIVNAKLLSYDIGY